jgi:sulfatase maturation enzyme AslB (radical SAM superfamily)
MGNPIPYESYLENQYSLRWEVKFFRKYVKHSEERIGLGIDRQQLERIDGRTRQLCFFSEVPGNGIITPDVNLYFLGIHISNTNVIMPFRIKFHEASSLVGLHP